MRDVLEFVKAALRNPLDVSTVFPTSRFLAENMIDRGELSQAKSIVELGAGTGAITKYLAPRIGDAKYLGVEIDSRMVDFLKTTFPALRFEAGLAEAVNDWVQPGTVDVVISSLPWTIFSEEMQERTVKAIESALRPGGLFLTYVCANSLLYPNAKNFLGCLGETFETVSRSSLEWRNVPPAFVYTSTKEVPLVV